MANSDKNILITPATNTSGDPRIVYTPNTAANVITQRITDSGTISFEGSAGQLFSINNSLTGTLFSVNDVSGIPSIDVADTGLVRISPYNGTLAIGSLAPIQISSVDSKVSITASSAAQVPLAIRGAASQSANLFEIQSSAGSILSRFSSSGQFVSDQQTYIGSGATSITNTRLNVATGSSSVVGQVIRGAASQSANLLQIQDSAAVVHSGFSANGYFWVGGSSTAGGQIGITAEAAANRGLVIKGAASQSANLLEIRNSADSLLSYTLSNGDWVMPNLFNSYAGVGTGYADYQGSATSLYVRPTATTRSGAVIKGLASQSANLLELQDSSANVLAAINGAGLISSVRQISVSQSNSGETMMFVRGAASQTGDSFAVRDSSANTLAGFSATGRIYSGVSGSGQTYLGGLTLGGGSVASQLGVVAGAATTIGAVIRGAASQTGNLQEWQDSSGNVLLAITSSGGIGSSGLTALRVDVNRNLALNSNSGSYGSGQAVTFIGNATTAPTTSPTGGGILFANSGALTYRGTSGGNTTIVNADGTTPYPTLTANNTFTGINSFVNPRTGYSTTATAAGTTTLTVSSNYQQFFTGTTTQTVQLPAPQTLTVGTSFLLVNNSTGTVSVIASNSAATATVTAGTMTLLTCVDITAGLGAANWNVEVVGFSGVTGTGNAVLATGPTLTTPSIGSATATRVNYGAGTIGAPTFTSYSAGVKEILYDNVTAASAGYTIGIDAGTFWQTIPAADVGQSFKWYGGTTVLATLTGGGALTTTGAVTTGGALNLNYASPSITSNNASAASIFTATVTSVTIGSSTIRTIEFPADGVVATAASGAGYMGLPQNATTSGAYTVVAADAGKHLYSANTRTVTINSNANLALPVGTAVTFVSGPGATTTIAITSDTMYLAGPGTLGSRTLAPFGMATAVKTGTTSWFISGNGLT